MTTPQAYIDGKPVFGKMTRVPVTVIRPRFARLPKWLITLLARFGVATTVTHEVDVFVLAKAPETSVQVVVMYETTFGED